jgi:hypothetical protein
MKLCAVHLEGPCLEDGVASKRKAVDGKLFPPGELVDDRRFKNSVGGQALFGAQLLPTAAHRNGSSRFNVHLAPNLHQTQNQPEVIFVSFVLQRNTINIRYN